MSNQSEKKPVVTPVDIVGAGLLFITENKPTSEELHKLCDQYEQHTMPNRTLLVNLRTNPPTLAYEAIGYKPVF